MLNVVPLINFELNSTGDANGKNSLSTQYELQLLLSQTTHKLRKHRQKQNLSQLQIQNDSRTSRSKTHNHKSPSTHNSFTLSKQAILKLC